MKRSTTGIFSSFLVAAIVIFISGSLYLKINAISPAGSKVPAVEDIKDDVMRQDKYITGSLFRIMPGPGNPRNSEEDFVNLKDGWFLLLPGCPVPWGKSPPYLLEPG